MAFTENAKTLASQGRNGDSTLVHMQPREVAGLQKLAQLNGTSLTVNPSTGMPEAFNLAGFLPMIAGAGLTATGLSPLMAGMLVGGTTAIAEGDLGAGLMAGMGAGSGGSLFKSFANVAPATTAAGTTTADIVTDQIASKVGTAAAPTFDAASKGLMGVDPNAAFASAGGNQLGAVGPNMGQVNTFPQFGTPTPAANTSMMQNANIRQPLSSNAAMGKVAAPNMNQVNPVSSSPPTNTSMMQNSRITEPTSLGQKFNNYTDKAATNFSTNTERAGRGVADLFEDGGIDRFAARNGAQPTRVNQYRPDGSLESYTTTPGEPLSNFEVAGKIGMPIAGGILGGIEESDLYEPFNASPYKEDNRFRGPENQLNLAGMSTLNLNNPYGRSPSSGGLSSLFAEGGNVKAESKSLNLNNIKPNYTAGTLNLRTGSNTPPPPAARVFSSPGQNVGGSSNQPFSVPTRKEYGTGGPNEVPSDYMGGIGTNYSQDIAGNFRRIAQGGMISGYEEGGYLQGPGDGMSDDIPATIGGTQEARLSQGEFVIPADVVSHMGNGSTEAGAKHFYNMMDRIRKDRTGTKKQGVEINPERYMST